VTEESINHTNTSSVKRLHEFVAWVANLAAPAPSTTAAAPPSAAAAALRIQSMVRGMQVRAPESRLEPSYVAKNHPFFHEKILKKGGLANDSDDNESTRRWTKHVLASIKTGAPGNIPVPPLHDDRMNGHGTDSSVVSLVSVARLYDLVATDATLILRTSSTPIKISYYLRLPVRMWSIVLRRTQKALHSRVKEWMLLRHQQKYQEETLTGPNDEETEAHVRQSENYLCLSNVATMGFLHDQELQCLQEALGFQNTMHALVGVYCHCAGGGGGLGGIDGWLAE
jgi:hypothetical protein